METKEKNYTQQIDSTAETISSHVELVCQQQSTSGLMF